MASANRHRKTQYWFHTVICRVIDVGAMNTRAILKKLGVEYNMVDLKRILATGLAKAAIRPEILTLEDVREEQVGNKKIKIRGPAGRLDGSFHFWSSSGKTRKQCKVHQSIRCETNKYCVNCQAYLCNGYAWAAWHTDENYKL